MAHTCKSEHRSDGFHIGHRLERQARPAGASARAFADDLDLDLPEPRPVSLSEALGMTPISPTDTAWLIATIRELAAQS